MQPEGMVHALEEIHRLLKPGGVLIDIHPTTDLLSFEVYKDGRMIFTLPDPDCAVEGPRQAEAALAQVVQRGLFAVEGREQFDYQVYGSSVAELREYIAEANTFDESPEDEAVEAREAELFARIEAAWQDAGEGAEVATHEIGLITCLRPIS